MEVFKSTSKENAEITRNQLKFYLGMFWVKPVKDVAIRAQAESCLKTKAAEGYLFSTQLHLKQFAQLVIMAYKRRVVWQAVNTYEIVEKYLQSEPIRSQLCEPELLIIYHGFNELPNKQLHNMTNDIISGREVLGKKTLLLSVKPDNEFCIPLKVLSGNTNTQEII